MDFLKLPQFLVAVTLIDTVLWGCSSPQTSRPPAINDVKIEESLSPDYLLVPPGDEVRWINYRRMNVVIDIPTLKSVDLTCNRGFKNWFGGVKETVALEPNQTASLCFKKPAVVDYNIRSETALAGGKRVHPGVVKVGKSFTP
jgi:hypothetical protein